MNEPLQFKCFQEIGVNLSISNPLHEGQVLEIPGLVGDTRHMTVRGISISERTAIAEDEHCVASLEMIDGQWRMTAMIYKVAAFSVQFV